MFEPLARVLALLSNCAESKDWISLFGIQNPHISASILSPSLQNPGAKKISNGLLRLFRAIKRVPLLRSICIQNENLETKKGEEGLKCESLAKGSFINLAHQCDQIWPKLAI